MVGCRYKHLCYYAICHNLYDYSCKGIHYRLDLLPYAVDDTVNQFPGNKILSAILPQTQCHKCIRDTGTAFQHIHTYAGIDTFQHIHDCAHGYCAVSPFVGTDSRDWYRYISLHCTYGIGNNSILYNGRC